MTRCEFRVRRGTGLVPCGRSCVFASPDGEVVGVYRVDQSTHLLVGPCHDPSLVVEYPFAAGEPYDPVDFETERERWNRVNRFRHALSPTKPPRVNGLVRQAR